MNSEQDNTAEGPNDLMESGSASAGDRLRTAREARGLELSNIASETRIPIRHLEAVETGDYESLPSRTYAIGFSRTYARVLGLDDKSITEAVRAELSEGQARTSSMGSGMEPGDPAKLPSAGLAWFGGLAALILAIGVIAFFSSYFSAGTELPTLIAEDTVEGGADGVAAGAGELASAEAQADQTGSTAATAGGQVVFTATGEGAWVRFFEEGGERLYEGVMQDGDTYEVPRDAQDPRLNTGRPNMLRITIDGQTVPPISEEMVPVGDAQVSAEALLARADAPATSANN